MVTHNFVVINDHNLKWILHNVKSLEYLNILFNRNYHLKSFQTNVVDLSDKVAFLKAKISRKKNKQNVDTPYWNLAMAKLKTRWVCWHNGYIRPMDPPTPLKKLNRTCI